MDEEDTKVDTSISRYITDELSDKLLRIMRDIDLGELEERDGEGLEVLPRSVLHEQTPVLLSFVRILCSVLGLNSQIKDDVGILKKNLLRSIQCNEYGTTTGADLPAYTLVLPDLILPQWNESRDVDLLRDTVLLKYLQEHPEDKPCIEMQLLEALNELVAQYYLQDLKCKRTNQVHSRRLCNHSTYGGSLVLSKSAEAFGRVLRDFSAVAEYYDMKLMTSQVSWLMSTSS
mmetsp:Transcript_41342/g.87963  ORF Transcript_41342/g.87963 Transcript_41342/m.87963 type:complete len:231 (-) Transcript_41342:64-756(-)